MLQYVAHIIKEIDIIGSTMTAIDHFPILDIYNDTILSPPYWSTPYSAPCKSDTII